MLEFDQQQLPSIGMKHLLDAILGALVGAEPDGDKFQVNLILRTWSWNLFLVRETVEIGVHFMLIRPCFMLTPYELAARQLLLAYSL